MKKLLLAVLLLLISPFIHAQKLTCTECKLKTTIGDMDAFEILIPKCDAADIEKSLQKWLKKHGGDVSEKKGEIKASTVLFKEFYQVPVTVYSRVEPSGEDVKMKISIDTGLGFKAIKAQADVYQKFKDAIKVYCVNEAKTAAQIRLDDAQKQLAKLNSDLSDLKKEKQHLQKEIDDYNASIEKDKQSLQKNDVNQDTKNTEINGQSQKVKDLQNELTGIY